MLAWAVERVGIYRDRRLPDGMIFLAFHYSDEFAKWTARGKTNTVRNNARLHARFAKLYLRSRLGGYAVAGLLVAAFLGWLGASLLQTPAFGIPGKVIKEILTTVSLLVPLVAACAIGFSARSPFGEEEETASRSLPVARLLHLGGLLVCGALLLSLATLTWELDHAGLAVGRNLAGLAGLALLTVRLLPSSLSWIGPFAYSVLAVTVNILSDDPPEGEWTRWIWWPLQPATDLPPAVVALTLLALGLGGVCLYRVRD